MNTTKEDVARILRKLQKQVEGEEIGLAEALTEASIAGFDFGVDETARAVREKLAEQHGKESDQ